MESKEKIPNIALQPSAGGETFMCGVQPMKSSAAKVRRKAV
jgi:hypothetical protein